MSKRDFLKSLIILATPLASSRAHAEALSILEHLQRESPNPYEEDLLRNPRKQILIAEKVGCGGVPGGPAKMKCIASD